MNITKDQWSAIGKAVLVFILALAAIFGYDFGVIQPREVQGGMSRGLGITRFTSDVWLQNSGMKVDKTLAVTGATTLTGGMTGDITGNVTGNVTGNLNASYAKVSAPTAAASATPAALINNAGAANDILSVQAVGTAVFSIGNAGVVNGQVLRYASTGQKIVCGQTNVTGTGALAHGLSTPTYVQVSLAQDVTGDCARLSYTNASATVTAKCWNALTTPAAAATVAAVNWCVIGTP